MRRSSWRGGAGRRELEERGDEFYDSDATDVEDVEANKGAAETLETTRFPKAGPQGSSAPKGRIHSVKEYVNHIDAQNGNFSASVTGGKNLAAVHTLSAEKFLAAVELGGMPMPSVAVTRLVRPYEWGGAGYINLIGKPEMVDPRKGADVFSADAWAGTMPFVERVFTLRKLLTDTI